ncbi:POC1 centriolar protein [Steccherinum ochraceum]|uniref:POC1 centriolar protein n=1 Tax=Steccherinum ochraceum TaxID=92696 RepID=A0A4V2MX93_9APHY|nr:POC1 centriolar protein [Steccherinum ochraceum]
MLLNLGVTSAHEVLPRGPPYSQLPNCRIKVIADGKMFKSTLSKHTVTPTWRETFTIPVLDMNAALSIQLWHDSSLPFTDYLLGEATITVEEALGRARDGLDFKLRLTRWSKALSAIISGASLVLSATLADDSTAVNDALLAAKQSVSSGSLRAATAEALDSARLMPATALLSNSTRLLQAVLTKLEIFIGIIDQASKIHPIACLAWGIVSSALKVVQGQFDRDARIIELLDTISGVYAFVDTIKTMSDLTPVLENNVDSALKQTMECALFIREYCGSGFAGRSFKQSYDISVHKKISGFMETFRALQRSIAAGVSLQTALVSYRVMDRVDTLAREHNLRKLNATELDASSRPCCLPSTRFDLLQDITTWTMTPTSEAKNILWLHGLAGSGKSTVATTLANFFRDLRRLGAFVFFNRDEPEKSAPSRVIRTIAAQLAAFDPRIGQAIARAIDNIPSICESPLALQFTEFIVKPLTTIETLALEGPIVVVLDALDECGTPATRESLLSVLAEQSAHLPSFLRIIITSRTEVDITDALELHPNIRNQELDIATSTNESDIAAFFRERLHTIRTKRKNRALSLPADWPGEEAIQSLTKRAAGLFVWASTACAFIDGHDPRARLHMLLHGDVTSTPIRALDALYSTALAAAGDWDDPDFVSSFQEILGTIVVSKEPLTVDIVDALLGLPADASSVHTIERFGCVLSWGIDQPIRTLHPSFVDFLTTPERCQRSEWFIDTGAHHRRVALKCLDHMEQYFKDDSAVPSAESVIPASVAYACNFYISHLASVPSNIADIATRVSNFLSDHLHDWLDAMDRLKATESVVSLLTTLLEWVRKDSTSSLDPAVITLEAIIVGAVHVTANLKDECPSSAHASADLRTTASLAEHSSMPSIFEVLFGDGPCEPALASAAPLATTAGDMYTSSATILDSSTLPLPSLGRQAVKADTTVTPIIDTGGGASLLTALPEGAPFEEYHRSQSDRFTSGPCCVFSPLSDHGDHEVHVARGSAVHSGGHTPDKKTCVLPTSTRSPAFSDFGPLVSITVNGTPLEGLLPLKHPDASSGRTFSSRTSFISTLPTGISSLVSDMLMHGSTAIRTMHPGLSLAEPSLAYPEFLALRRAKDDEVSATQGLGQNDVKGGTFVVEVNG